MIPASGTFSLSNVNTEVGRASGSANSLDDAVTRLLTCDATRIGAFGSPWSMSELRSRSGAAFNAFMKDQGGGKVGAIAGDGVNPSPIGTMVSGITVAEISSGGKLSPFGAFAISTLVKLNCSTPFNRFFAMGVWHGANYLGAFKMADHNGEADGGTYITLAWALSAYGPDLRPYVGQTLTFVFVV
jgi:hypothetical protein